MTQSLLLKITEADPARTLAVFESGARWTYQDALELSWRVGSVLAELGVMPGEPVSAFLPNGPEIIALFFGANAAGAIFAPINVAYRGSILAHAINLPRARVMVVHESLADRLEGLDLPHLQTVVVVGGEGSAVAKRWHRMGWDALVNGRCVAPDGSRRRLDTDDMTYIYTSGTTGPSKAVRCSYRHHEVYADWYGRELGVDDRAFLCLPMFHVGGTGWLYTMLHHGGSVALVPRFSSDSFWPSVRSMGVTTCTFMAAMATFLMSRPRLPDDADNPIRIACLVPKIPEADAFAERFNVQLWTGYGMSEVPGPLRSVPGQGHLESAGRKSGDQWQLKLVDDQGDEVGVNEIGELLVRHERPAVVTRGYLNMPEATATAWMDGWFHTGDLLRRDGEGFYHFVDRNKDALRRRGENISSVEVEREIQRHRAVLDCAVIGVPSAEMEDDVMAYITLGPDERATEEEIFLFLVDQLPHFMVPRYIEFISEMPRTPNHKIAKGDLRNREVGEGRWDCQRAGYLVKASGVVRTRLDPSPG